MKYLGFQWEVTQKIVRRIDDGSRYDFSRTRLAEVEDYGWGPVYSWFTHLADTKDGFNLHDFERAFRAAWSDEEFGPLDETRLALSIQQAKSFLES